MVWMLTPASRARSPVLISLSCTLYRGTGSKQGSAKLSAMWFRGGLLVCLLVTPAYAQDVRTTSIFAGSVVDSVTRQPIAKASIRLTGEVTYGGSTNLEGAFRFEAVKPGEYQFDISHRGYTDSHAVALKP